MKVNINGAGHQVEIDGPDPHAFAGRQCVAAGAMTYCRCGLVFFEDYALAGVVESGDTRRQALDRSDRRWQEHRNAAGRTA